MGGGGNPAPLESACLHVSLHANIALAVKVVLLDTIKFNQNSDPESRPRNARLHQLSHYQNPGSAMCGLRRGLLHMRNKTQVQCNSPSPSIHNNKRQNELLSPLLPSLRSRCLGILAGLRKRQIRRAYVSWLVGWLVGW